MGKSRVEQSAINRVSKMLNDGQITAKQYHMKMKQIRELFNKPARNTKRRMSDTYQEGDYKCSLQRTNGGGGATSYINSFSNW